VRRDAFFALQFRAKDLARDVVADDADEQTFRAEACDVARHVAGAADDDLLAADPDHRRRRLRRDARHLAVDEIVKHQVADAEHGLPADLAKPFLEIEHQR
jgi:hypothetical protein